MELPLDNELLLLGKGAAVGLSVAAHRARLSAVVLQFGRTRIAHPTVERAIPAPF
jgi:hypothetical protein